MLPSHTPTLRILALLVGVAASTAAAQDAGTHEGNVDEKVFPKRPYSPYAGRSFPGRPRRRPGGDRRGGPAC